jgi:hypothetical protein
MAIDSYCEYTVHAGTRSIDYLGDGTIPLVHDLLFSNDDFSNQSEFLLDYQDGPSIHHHSNL